METLRLIRKNRKYIAELFNKIDEANEMKERNFNIDINFFTLQTNNLDYDTRSSNDIKKIKGDIWEIFGEMFLTYFKGHFDYNDYRLLEDYEDYGVDATATNINGEKCVIQYKYRSFNCRESALKYADLAKTYTQGKYNFGYPLKGKGTIILFTNLKEEFISREITTFFGDTYLCFNDAIIDTYVNNKTPFWNYCLDKLMESGVFE